MDANVKYKTEHLFESTVWEGMRDSIHISLGICLSYLTDGFLIPLQYASKPNANNKLYSLKPGVDPAGYSFQACP